MKIRYGHGKTEFGPGVDIHLTGSEVALAIHAYLVARNVHVSGACTIRVNGDLCKRGRVYVDPGAFVIKKGKKFSGRGPDVDEASISGVGGRMISTRNLKEQE